MNNNVFLKKHDVSALDSKAEKHVRNLTIAVGAASAAPVLVNWTAVVPLIAVCICNIGKIYGFEVTKTGAVHFIKLCLSGAGMIFMATNLAFKFAAAFLQSTGVGYGWGLALDASITTAAAYAIGASAKLYFRDLYLNNKRMSENEIVRNFMLIYEQRRREKDDRTNQYTNPHPTRARSRRLRHKKSFFQSISNFIFRKKTLDSGLPPAVVKRLGVRRRHRKPSFFSSLFKH